MPAGVDVIDVPTAVGLCVRGDCEAVRQRSPGQLGEVVVLPLGGRLRAFAELVNVPELVNEMDVLAAVTLRVPGKYVAGCGRAGWGSGGQRGKVAVLPLGGRLRASGELVNVPELVNEMDVLAGVRLRVPGKYVAGSWRAGWGSGGQRGKVAVLPLGGRLRASGELRARVRAGQ